MKAAATAPLRAVELGTVAYGEALRIQAETVEKRLAGEVGDTVLLLEHPPVLTKGRRTEPGELGMGEGWYRAQGIEVAETGRGGRVTYHGPGQSVLYPIVDLGSVGEDRHASVRAYVSALERAMIAALTEHGVPAQVFGGLTGVWTGGAPPVPIGTTGPERAPVSARDPELAAIAGPARKIGSIGIHVTRGVTSHGLAVNVTNDLQPFEWIVPCGIDSARMTSVAAELRAGDRGAAVPEAIDYSRSTARALAAALGLELIRADADAGVVA